MHALKKIISILKSFTNDKRGVSAIMFAVTAPVVVVSVGMAVDLGMAYHNQHKLQYAIDTAALSGNVINRATNAEITKLIQDVAVANFDDNLFASLNRSDVEVDFSDPSKIKVSASIVNNNILLPLFDLQASSSNVGAYTETKKPLDGLEIIMVLDNSNSMQNDNKMTGLKDAANKFVDKLLGIAPADNEIKIGIIPYSRGVNVGYYSVGKDVNGSNYSGSSFVTQSALDPRTYSQSKEVWYYKTLQNPRDHNLWGPFNPDLWNGCVYEDQLINSEGGSHNPPWQRQRTCYDPQGAKLHNSKKYNTKGLVYSDPSYITFYPTRPNLWQSCKDVKELGSSSPPPWRNDGWCYSPDGSTLFSNRWPQCHELDTWYEYQPAKSAVPPSTRPCIKDGLPATCTHKGSGPKAAKDHKREYNPNGQCQTAPLLPLQSSKQIATSRANLSLTIDSMNFYPYSWVGSTYTEIGLAWAYHMLSPSHPFEEAVSFSDHRWAKSVVLMSDGFIATDKRGDGPYANTTANSTKSKKTFRNVCNKLKNQKVIIYTIQFGTEMDSDAAAKNDFVNCASDPSKFYFAADNDDLEQAFLDIAKNLGKSKLLK